MVRDSTSVASCVGLDLLPDGKELGTTDGLFLVPPGTGKLSITLDGQQPEIRQIEISEGRITRIEPIRLERAGVAGRSLG